jgi:methyltransferase family protein
LTFLAAAASREAAARSRREVRKGFIHESHLPEPHSIVVDCHFAARSPDRARFRAADRRTGLHLRRHATVSAVCARPQPHRGLSCEEQETTQPPLPLGHVGTAQEAPSGLTLIVDQQTLAAYDSAAQTFAADWHDQPPPTDLHAIVKRFFKSGLTADVGCGSGREVAWLCANGFPTVGYDPSQGLLDQARGRYPSLDFRTAALPELTGIAADTFENVLCETVLMHLSAATISASVERLITILKPNGVLYLSWRVSQSDGRDQYGRLYAAFDKNLVAGALSEQSILLDEEVVSASSGKTVHRIVAHKRSPTI